MTRKPLQGIKPVDIFMHATGFHQAESYLADVENPQLAIEMSQATMVLSALNSELFLKCLICLETGLVPQGHHLLVLFEQLSLQTQISIEKMWDSQIVPLRDPMWKNIEASMNDGEPIKRDLRSALEAGSRAFEKIRYSYEPNSRGSQFYISDLPRLLGYIILEKKPEWMRLRRKVDQIT